MKYDLKGHKYGKLLVIDKTTNPNNKRKSIFWDCLCDCGKHSIVSTTDLRSGKTTQCWDCAHKSTGFHKRKNYIGQEFGWLTVKDMNYEYFDDNGRQRTICTCECRCGNVIERKIDSLLRNKNALQSCGCARKKNSRFIK